MSEESCGKKATHRFTWPGRNESFICEGHLLKLQHIADAMGMYIQIIPVYESDQQNEICKQVIT